MLRKFSARIIRMRRVSIAVFALLTVLCAYAVTKTVINYDFTVYLNENTVTRRSLNIMNSEFGNTDQITVMLSDPEEGLAEQLTEVFNSTDGIMRAVYSEESDVKVLDGTVYKRIHLYVDSPDSVAFVSVIKDKLLTYSSGYSEYWLNGAGPATLDIENKIYEQIPIAMIIAIVVVVAVLFLTSRSYFEPVIFAIVLLVSIVINMGTNFIFSSISFVTFAVAAILQLALAMDYSIMLLHNFSELRDNGMDDESAIVTALADSFMPISSSALTTVSGLISLMFMSFTIGFDIGIVLSKGILISMITVFTLMPALIYFFRNKLRSTAHKVVPLGGSKTAKFAFKTRKIVPWVLICAIICAGILQLKNVYTFTGNSDTTADSDPVSRVFGMSNQLVLLLPANDTDAEYDRQREFIARAKELTFNGHPAVTDVTGMVTTGEAAIRYYTVEEIASMLNLPGLAVSMYMGSMGFSLNARGDELIGKAASIMTENKQVQDLKDLCDFAKAMFLSENYSRLILLLDVPTFGEDAYRVVDEIIALMEEFYPSQETGIAGNLMSSYDISSAFTADTRNVTLITIIAIFLIILFSFRNFIIPVVLICVIQGAVWLNMSVSAITETPVFFMSYLITLAIQMGATIDYGILMTTNYREARKEYNRQAALIKAIELSMPTIFTSGLILVLAGFIIGKVCTVFYISSIGLMLARGTLFSLCMILLLLPPLLLNFDKRIVKDAVTE